MPDETKEPDDDIEMLPSLSMDEGSDEKVEALWRQLMVYKSFAENDLAEARARRARAEAARQETTDLRRQAFKEIKTILTRVENMNSAVNEELETQRILTNVAKLKVSPKWMLAELTGETAEDGIKSLNADESGTQDLEGEEPQATGAGASTESSSKSTKRKKASRNS